MNAGSALQVHNVVAGYDAAHVLSNVSITVQPGRVTCILGANGSGKSTLIRTIVGLNAARQGEIRFGEETITGWAAHRIAALGIATVLEGNRVFPRMTVIENLKVGAIMVRDRSYIDRRLGELFEIFPRLAERRAQQAGTLSGGERAMLSIARGLMTDPRLIIFDEPSLGLSPLFVAEVFKVIRRLKSAGQTVLLVEQNVRQTLDVADYGYVLAQGRVVASGEPHELMHDPELQKAYFGTH